MFFLPRIVFEKKIVENSHNVIVQHPHFMPRVVGVGKRGAY